MQRARRLASVAVVASLAVAGLTACRSAPGTDAYIGAGAGSATISQDEVEALYKDARANGTGPRTETDGSVTQPAQLSRQDILATLVGLDVLRKYGKDSGVTPQAVAPAQVASSLFLDPAAKYVPVYAQYEGYLEAAAAKVQPQQLTEAEVRDVYDRLNAAGVLPNSTFESWAGNLDQSIQQLLGQRIGLQKQLAQVAAKMDIVVNPRYQPSFSLLTPYAPTGKPIPLVEVPVGNSADAVPVADAG